MVPSSRAQAGEIIWHLSMITHATITHDEPLLAVCALTKDVETGAKLVNTPAAP
jgi:hypothetical protein